MPIRVRKIPFAIVDVFTTTPLGGNPLAVVPEADLLSDAEMQAIAREFHQSETTFLLRPSIDGADWRLRSFTGAGVEVFGAGHNALGAWWWLAESGKLTLPGPVSHFKQELGGRLLPVTVLAKETKVDVVAMRQAPPQFGSVWSDATALAAALRLAADDLGTSHQGGSSLTPQVVSTGAAHLLVPLRTRDAVDRARPDADLLRALLKIVSGQGCYLFVLEPLTAGATAYARFFNPTVGIEEDPATGSAAGPLACYLAKHEVVTDGSTISVDQGHFLARPSRIDVRISGSEVEVLGRGVTVAEGRLLL